MKLTAPASLALFVATAATALADTTAPHYAGTVASCTFLTSCSAGVGDANNSCTYSSGAAQALQVSNFGFDLPANTSAINGFIVEPKSGDDGCHASVQLVKDGTPAGEIRTLEAPQTNMCGLTQYIQVGANDAWGTSWTRDDVNDADFGVRISNNGCTGVGIDTVRIAVLYTLGDDVCGDGYTTGAESCEDGNTIGGDGCSRDCTVEAPLTKEQQDCVNTVNAGVVKVLKAVSKAQSTCQKAYAKDDMVDLAECSDADNSNPKVIKVYQKLLEDAAAVCTSGPPFGYTNAASGGGYAFAVGSLTYVDLVELFPGDYVTGDKAASNCQAAIAKAKTASTLQVIGTFNKCKKAKLAGKKVAQAKSAADLETCMPTRDVDAELPFLAAFEKKCGGQSLDELLSGFCSGSPSDQTRADCLADRAYCYACFLAKRTDGLPGLDCDLLDNGADDDSCGTSVP